MDNLSTSQYVEHTENAFVQSMNKISDLEGLFGPERRENIPEYGAERKRAATLAADLIKFGENKTVADEKVTFVLNDKEYSLRLDDFKAVLDEDQYKILFPKKETCEEYDEYTDSVYGDLDDPYGISPMQMSVQYPNPIANLLAALIAPMSQQAFGMNPMGMPMGMQGRGSSDGLSRDFDNIQRKIGALEEEKNRARKKVAEVSDKFEKLREQMEEARTNLGKNELLIKDLQDKRDELVRDLDAVRSEAEKSSASDLQRIEELNQTISDINATVAQREEEIKTLKEDNETLTAMLQEEEEESKLLKEIGSEYEEKLQDLNEELEKKNDELKQKSGELEVRDAELVRKNAELDQISADLAQKSSELEQRTTELIQSREEQAQTAEELRQKSEETDSLERKIKNLTEDIEDKEERYKKMKAARDDAGRQLDEAMKKSLELNNKVADVKASLGSAEEKNRTLEARVRELESQVRNKENQLQSLQGERKRDSDKLRRARDLENEVSTLQSDKARMEKDVERLEREKREAEDKLKAQTDASGEMADKNSNLEREVQELKELAYSDVKYGAMNLNAFNRDLGGVEKDAITIAMLSINGMKRLNEKYGRQSGDGAIKTVSNSLVDMFGARNVYRIMGDQFAVISGEEEIPVSTKVEEICKNLARVSIELAYGVVAGKRCISIEKMIKTAEEEMLGMKNVNGRNGGGSDTTSGQKPVQKPNSGKPQNAEKPQNTDKNQSAGKNKGSGQQSANVKKSGYSDGASNPKSPAPVHDDSDLEETNVDQMLANLLYQNE